MGTPLLSSHVSLLHPVLALNFHRIRLCREAGTRVQRLCLLALVSDQLPTASGPLAGFRTGTLGAEACQPYDRSSAHQKKYHMHV